MLIIDFNGLPGCGKSTYSSKLYNLLKKEKVYCELLNNNEYIAQKNSNKKNIINYIRLLIPKNFLYLIKLLFKSYKLKKTYKRELSLKDKIWKMLRIIILHDRIYSVAKQNKKGILIIDQGIIQDYVDYMLDKNINENDILEYENTYVEIKSKIIVVNLNIEKCEAVKRINKRNRDKYDVDKMTQEKLEEFLELYKIKLNNVKKIFDKDFVNIELDVNDDKNFNNNIENVLQIIKESSEN